MNDYEPIRIKPLRLRGIYGIAWMIYKRSFASMFLFTLVIYGIATIAIAAINGGSTAGLVSFLESLESGGFPGYDSFGMSVNNPFQAIAGSVSLSIILWLMTMLLGLGYALVLQPMIAGGLYTEASARLYGKYSGFKALLRRSKHMLRRFFTTNLCQMLAEWAISIVIGLVVGVLIIILVLMLTFSLIASSTLSVGAIVALVAVALVIIAATVTGMSFLAFVYPVAVNEGLKNFKAIERSFKLVSKRFGRVLGVSMTLALVAAVASLPIAAVSFFLIEADRLLAMFVLIPLEIVLACLCMPYGTALYTVLYFDARVRLEGEGWLNYPEPSFSGQAASVQSNAHDGPTQTDQETSEEPRQEPMNQQSDELSKEEI